MNTNAEAWVVVYTVPDCPDCRALKAWLWGQGVPFVEKDLADPAVAQEPKARTGVGVAPVTRVGADVFHGTFASQKPAIAGVLGLSEAA